MSHGDERSAICRMILHCEVVGRTAYDMSGVGPTYHFTSGKRLSIFQHCFVRKNFKALNTTHCHFQIALREEMARKSAFL